MDEIKQDLRVRHTKQLLKSALLTILQAKTIDKVTVTELCKVAHINRNTFYSHYRSPGDLLDEVEKNFANKILKEVEGPYREGDYAMLLQKVCRTVYDDRELAQILATEGRSGNFMNDIIQDFYKIMMECWSGSSAPQEKLDNLYRYGVGGSYALLRQWVNTGFQSTPDAMAEELLQLNLAVLEGYLGDYPPLGIKE